MQNYYYEKDVFDKKPVANYYIFYFNDIRKL